MKGGASKKVVYAALAGNTAITAIKFFAAYISGSSAMLAEAFHSTADTLNQVMLLFGLRLSKRPPDEDHPFGHGKEVYFWGFVVAVSIFFVGAALSIYEGIIKIAEPHPVTSIYLPLSVLGASALFELYSFTVAFAEAKKKTPSKGPGAFIRMAAGTKDPTVAIVLFEDSAALLGLLVAAAGIYISHITGMPVIDALTSIVIGIILLAVAFFLAKETKGLLIGESASREDRKKILRAVHSVQGVKSCIRLMTMHMGPEDILVNLEIDFSPDLSTEELEKVIDNIEKRIREALPSVKKIFIEAESIKGGARRRYGD